MIPFTHDIARTAARINAEVREQGLVISFQDLQIGSTAVHYGYAIVTNNVRHFQMIPNLEILTF